MKRKLFIFLSLLFTVLCSAQTSKNVNVTNAGSLSTLINATEKQSITDIVVSGNIDTRDFRFMRDEMTVLANIDISNVTIQSYTGTDGTNNGVSTVYPANQIPKFSFYNLTVGKKLLKSIIFPNSLQSIGDDAFYDCDGLTEVNIPNSVQTIGYAAFQYCDGFNTINLGSGLSSIGDQAFYKCLNLRIVNLSAATPPTYGGYAFRLSNLSIVYVPDGSVNLYKTTDLWKDLPIASNKVITVNNSAAGGIIAALNGIGITAPETISKLIVTGYVNSADFTQFRNSMPLLMELDLSGATLDGNTVPANALQNKTILTKVKLPSTVVSIGDYAFSNCGNLAEIFPLSTSLTSIGAYAFWKCLSIKSELLFPSSLKTIGSFAFNTCSGLKGSLSIPNSVTSIGSYAFQGCSGFDGTLSLPATITTIPSGAFAGCTGIMGALTIPESVTTIDASAFYDFKKITELVMGNRISTIGDEVFRNAANLSKITITSTVPPTITSTTFGGVPKSTCELYVPDASVQAYKAADCWKEFITIKPLSSIGSYSVSMQVGIGGTVSVNSMNYGNGSVIYANKDAVVTFNIVPNTGYEIASLTFNGTDVLSQITNGQYTTSVITGNSTFTVSFKKKTYNITIELGAGGIIKEGNVGLTNGSVLVADENSVRTFTILPSEGYILDAVTYAGVDVKSHLINNQYTTSQINSNAALNVTFLQSSATYGINVKIGTNGDVKENNVILMNDTILKVNINAIKTFTFVPATGYEIATVTYGGVDVMSQVISNQFTTPLVTSDVILDVTFKKLTYSITVQIGAGGSVQENSVTLTNNSILSADINTTKTFTIVPDAGYKIASLTYNGVDVITQLNNNQYTTPVINANSTLSVTFSLIQTNVNYGITVTVGSGGIVKENNVSLANGAVLTVLNNTTKTFTLVSNAGYEVATLTYNGADVKSQINNNQFTTPAVNANATLNVTFKKITYNITMQIGLGGVVTESNVSLANGSVITVDKNATKTFVFTPDAGYVIATLTYGGTDVKSQISGNQYTTPTVNANATLNVTFKKITFTITLQMSSGGRVMENNISLTDGTVLTVDKNTTKTFTIIPDAGYEIATLTYGGVDVKSQLSNNQFTTPAVNGYVTLNVTFRKITYNITVQISLGGVVNESNVNLTNGAVITVDINTTKAFTILPDAGYEIATLTYGGVDVESQISNNQFTTPAVNANATLNVTFKKITFTITLQMSSGGRVIDNNVSLTDGTVLTVDKNSTKTFTIIPDTGYEVTSLTYAGLDVKSQLNNNQFTTPAVNGYASLVVSFEAKTATPVTTTSNVKVYAAHSEIVVEGTNEGEIISVYTINGSQILSLISEGERMVLPVQPKAVYLVKTTGKTYKVIL